MSAGELVDEEERSFACRQVPVGGRGFAIVLCMPAVAGAALTISLGSGAIRSGAGVKSCTVLADLSPLIPGVSSCIPGVGCLVERLRCVVTLVSGLIPVISFMASELDPITVFLTGRRMRLGHDPTRLPLSRRVNGGMARSARERDLIDLIDAETIDVLESFYTAAAQRAGCLSIALCTTGAEA